MRHAAALLVALSLLAHGAGLANGFVFDDHRFVVRNEALLTASPWQLLTDPATQTRDDDRDVWRPLRALGHAFDRRRWGLEPFGFHLHSLLAHVACVLLAFHGLRRLLPAPGDEPALLGAALLACHPLGVEVVGWVSSRGDLYAAGCGWLALLVAARGGRLAPALAGLLALAAMLGKESALWVALVAALHARLAPGRAPNRALRRACVLALAAGVAAGLVLRQLALSGTSPQQTAPHGGSWFTQIGWALQGTGRMLAAFVRPLELSVDRPQLEWAQLAGAPWWSWGTAVALALLGAAVVLRRRRPALAFALGAALLAWLPSSSLLVTLRMLVTDRGAYPCLPFLGAALGVLLVGRPRTALLATLAGATLLVPLAVARTADFASDATLWRATLRQNPASVRAWLGLAAAAGDPEAAEEPLRRAAALARPGSADQGLALARLGTFLLRHRGDPAQAESLLHRAWVLAQQHRDRERADDEECGTAATLAEALTLLGRDDEARAVLEAAIAAARDPFMLHVKDATLALLRHARAGDDAERRRLALERAARALHAARAVSPHHPLTGALATRLAELQLADG